MHTSCAQSLQGCNVARQQVEDNREVQLVLALHAKVRGCRSCTEGPTFLQSVRLSPLLSTVLLAKLSSVNIQLN